MSSRPGRPRRPAGRSRPRGRREGQRSSGKTCESWSGPPPETAARTSYIRLTQAAMGRGRGRWYLPSMTAADLPSDWFSRSVTEIDPEIAQVLEDELHRQESTLEMIASENFVPQSVLECQGSVLTNKYAEGYPGRRYYGGCEFVDVAENLAIERAKEVFGGDHVNVQPHAGAQANAAVYHALLEPGDP